MTADFICEFMKDVLIFLKFCFFVQLIFLIEENIFIYVQSSFLIMWK